MRAALSKIAIRKAVGLYFGDQEVALSKVASTPLGPVEIASYCERCTPDELPGVMERLITAHLGRKRRSPVAVAIPGSRLFFGTRLVPNGAPPSGESVLQKALCSSNISIEDLTVDLLRGNVDKQPAASVVACRRKYIAGIVGLLGRFSIRPLRSEPAPCSLVRLAAQQHRSPRRARTLLRVFLNTTHGLAVSVAGDFPLGWRSFVLPEGMEGISIVSAARTLQTQQQHYGIRSSLDCVMIHGRGDLHARLQEDQFADEMGTRVLWYENPMLDASAIAKGAALGCLAQERQAFDLSRSLKARASIKEVFPWGELSFAAGLITCMAVILGEHAMKLDEACVTLRAQNSQHACLVSGDPVRLEKDKKAMQEKLDAVRGFLGTRIAWSSYLRDLSERLPGSATLGSLSGRNSLKLNAKSKAPTGSFDLRGTAPLAKDGAIPRDVDTFLRAIQRDPLWKRDFDTIATDIKLPLSAKKGATGIDFTINCLRSSKQSAAPKNEAASKKEAK